MSFGEGQTKTVTHLPKGEGKVYNWNSLLLEEITSIRGQRHQSDEYIPPSPISSQGGP